MSTTPLDIAFAAAIFGGLLSTINMSLREVSRGRLQKLADRDNGMSRLDPILDDLPGHALAVSLPRLILNIIVVAASLVWFTGFGEGSVVSWERLAYTSLVAGA
ncbi:MAG: hypothetical protein VYC34_00165, partial [Planctomycetota bacterium]|nr:hypothetical protein [Planctomycetota bacterium]